MKKAASVYMAKEAQKGDTLAPETARKKIKCPFIGKEWVLVGTHKTQNAAWKWVGSELDRLEAETGTRFSQDNFLVLTNWG